MATPAMMVKSTHLGPQIIVSTWGWARNRCVAYALYTVAYVQSRCGRPHHLSTLVRQLLSGKRGAASARFGAEPRGFGKLYTAKWDASGKGGACVCA